MKSVGKVLIVTHRFWPAISDSTLRLVHWIERLNRAGLETCVLTSRGSSSWSRHMQFERTSVARMNVHPRNPLRNHRYVREIREQVAQLSADVDLLYVDDIGTEAEAILGRGSVTGLPPAVVRYELTAFPGGNHSGWQPPRSVLEVCRKASALLTPCAAAHQSLLAAGIINTPILRMEDWHGRCLDRSLGGRRAARQILGSVNHDLHLRSSDLLVVCPGELSRDWGVDILIRAMQAILEKNRRVRLWILGDGPERESIYKLLEQLNLHRVVAMPGIFTDLDSVLQVADLCVFPAAGQGLSWLAPTCAASNIPMILADSPQARTLCAQASDIRLFPEQEAGALQQRIEAWLRNATPLARATLELQRLALSRQQQSREIVDLLSIIQPPLASPSSTGT